MNVDKLDEKMREKGFNRNSLAKSIKLSKSSFSQRMHGKTKFSLNDVRKIVNTLDLTSQEIKDIFLS